MWYITYSVCKNHSIQSNRDDRVEITVYLIEILKQNGFLFQRAKGSHQLFYNATTGKTIVVPVHGGKDLKKGTFLAILKQADIDKNDWI